ncbi:MAG: DASS family sodium-coupled anion symporter [Planctomycetota bacterium]|nr:DASS family sodium-coupled anion symporter [Planctomycetota bacterium]
MRTAQRVGFFLGILGFVALLVAPSPPGLSPEGRRTAAVTWLMAVFWMTEAIPIPATALLPLCLFPSLGILDMPTTSAPYANDLIFLFLGGFFIALAMERWGLHRRIALGIVARVGTTPARLVLGFMLASAFLSMWISNTATTALMLPIAVAVAQLLRPADTEGRYEFGICLMLGIAYAATMGGVSTLIGTPPNAVLAAAASEILDVEIGFLEWMAVGVPVSAVFLPLGWLLLTRFIYPPGDLRGDAALVIAEERKRCGPISRPERIVAIVFVLTALAWILRSPKELGDVTIPGIQTWAPAIKDSTIAIAAALTLFLLPVSWSKGQFALDWDTAKKVPWGVMLLFGGGLSLARAMEHSGLAEWIGSGVASLDFLPVWILLGVVAVLFVFLTEITSNVATCTMAMPVMAAAAVGLGIEPLILMGTAALSASMAFMLPVATPPNAIVFGSGYLTIAQMVRAGIWLNLIAIALVTAAALLLVPTLLG